MDSIICVFCRRYLALKKMRNKNKFFCIFSLTHILVCDRVFGRRFGCGSGAGSFYCSGAGCGYGSGTGVRTKS